MIVVLKKQQYHTNIKYLILWDISKKSIKINFKLVNKYVEIWLLNYHYYFCYILKYFFDIKKYWFTPWIDFEPWKYLYIYQWKYNTNDNRMKKR